MKRVILCRGESRDRYLELEELINGAVLSFDRIIGYLKDKKASVLQFPERIEFVDKMPLTAAGKLNKRALKEDIIAKLAK